MLAWSYMKNVLRGFLILSVVVIMGQGCNPFQRAQEKAGEAFVEKMVESQTEGKVKLDLDRETVDFETEDGTGQMRLGEGSKLADNFPDDVPRYPEASYVSSVVTNEGKTAIANFRTEDSPEDVQAWFKSELEGDGFELDLTFQAGASLQLYKKGDVKISVQSQADEDNGLTVVSIQRAE